MTALEKRIIHAAEQLFLGRARLQPSRKRLEIRRALQAAERPLLYQDTTLRAAQKLCFVSGHDFSRAVNDQENVRALAPEVRLSCPLPTFSASQGKLVQLPILSTGLFQDWYARVSVFPKHEEILVSGFCLVLVSR